MSSGWAVVVLAVAGAARLSPPPRVQLASLYAPLFQPGRTWRYRVERTVEYQDPDKPVDARPTTKKNLGEATCRVTRLVQWKAAVGSKIECDGELARESVRRAVPAGDALVEGAWMASADGLWRIDAAALDGPQPVGDRSAKIISPRPTRFENQNGDEDGHEEIRKLERVAGRWCRTDGISSGDQYSDTLCFDSADGLSFGTRQFSGGEFCEVRFCLRPRDCRALGR